MQEYEKLIKKLNKTDVKLLDHYLNSSNHTLTQLIVGTFFGLSMAGTLGASKNIFLMIFFLMLTMVFAAIWSFYLIKNIDKIDKLIKKVENKSGSRK